MNTKKPIVDFFTEHLCEYGFVPTLRPALVFRHSQPNGIFQTIAVGRASPPDNELFVDIASTYDPSWQGGPAYPTGIDTPLSALRFSARFLSPVKSGYTYNTTPDGLKNILKAIHKELKTLAPPFFKRAERSLLSNRLLQIALAEARRISPEERAGLEDALAGVRRLAKVEHPAYFRVRDALRRAWTPDISKEERRRTSRLAIDSLIIASFQERT